MESQTSFVRPQGGVELYTIATIDLHPAFVVLPDNSELYDPLGDRRDLQSGFIFGVLLEKRGVLKGGCKLWQEEEVSGGEEQWEKEGCVPLYACSNSGSDGRFDMVAMCLWY